MNGVELLSLLSPEVDLITSHLHGVVGHQGGGLGAVAVLRGGRHEVLDIFVLLLLGKFLDVQIKEGAMDQLRGGGGLGRADLSHDDNREGSENVYICNFLLIEREHCQNVTNNVSRGLYREDKTDERAENLYYRILLIQIQG